MTTTNVSEAESYPQTQADATRYCYELIEFASGLSDERINAIGLAIFPDSDSDVEGHQRGCSIEASLRALRATCNALFYLLPEEDLSTPKDWDELCEREAARLNREASAD